MGRKKKLDNDKEIEEFADNFVEENYSKLYAENFPERVDKNIKFKNLIREIENLNIEELTKYIDDLENKKMKLEKRILILKSISNLL